MGKRKSCRLRVDQNPEPSSSGRSSWRQQQHQAQDIIISRTRSLRVGVRVGGARDLGRPRGITGRPLRTLRTSLDVLLFTMMFHQSRNSHTTHATHVRAAHKATHMSLVCALSV
jgi:hypothetical protein